MECRSEQSSAAWAYDNWRRLAPIIDQITVFDGVDLSSAARIIDNGAEMANRISDESFG